MYRNNTIMKLTADFETTTNELDCRVWAWGVCEIGNPNYFIHGNNIDGFFNFCENSENSTIYFHNLKFDGEFILCWLFENGFKHVKDRKELKTKTFTTLISDKGQFYSMKIVFKKIGKKTNFIVIYDSLKILPFSVDAIAKGFNLPITKLEIDYNKPRPVGYKLTPEEIDYLKNDAGIVARALTIIFGQDLEKMTAGSNALFDYKRTVSIKSFDRWFPVPEYDEDVRKSYKGGFTYLNPKYKGVDIGKGIVLDVNSLYPSVMRNRPLPYGEGIYFEGQYKTDVLYNLYVQMLTCQFEIKPGHIPIIQLKNNLSFIPTEYLTTSGDEEVTLCLTNVDLDLFFKHYDIYNLEYHSGWKFKSTTGLFTEYIDKWTDVKIQASIDNNNAMRTLAKLMLNSLYGKFALNPNVQSKIPYYDNRIVKYYVGDKETRTPLYIPVGTFVTSWARYTTITSAQSVYARFIYADTDSLHLIGEELPDNLDIDPVNIGKWKHESTFTRARFLRQKSYIEEIDGEIKITCAGLPESCYKYVTWDNFKAGASYPGKLQPKHVPGGIVLKDIDFTINN